MVNGYPVGALNISAENNWWGAAAEPFIQAKIYDWFDDASLGIINYDPYLTSPDKDAPMSPPGNPKKSGGGNAAASGVAASAVGGDVELTWSANSEADFAGYKVYYGSTTGYSFANMVDVGSDTFYTVTGASITDTIAITAYDLDADGVNDQLEGNESWFVYATVDSIVGIDDEFAGIPEDFELYQNYPNPFNPSTIIKYALPKASNISLVIYNLLGQEIMRWSESDVSPGYHEMRWNGTSQTGSPVSSGIYIYRIVTDDFVQTKKMLLLK